MFPLFERSIDFVSCGLSIPLQFRHSSVVLVRQRHGISKSLTGWVLGDDVSWGSWRSRDAAWDWQSWRWRTGRGPTAVAALRSGGGGTSSFLQCLRYHQLDLDIHRFQLFGCGCIWILRVWIWIEFVLGKLNLDSCWTSNRSVWMYARFFLIQFVRSRDQWLACITTPAYSLPRDCMFIIQSWNS